MRTIRLLEDKTLIVEVISWMNKGRSIPLAESILKEMKKDPRWYEEPSIPREIKAAITKLIDDVERCHRAKDAKGAFELLMSKKEVDTLKENAGAYRAVVAQFELTNLEMIIQAFQAIDWKTAKYYESENAVGFEGCPFRQLVDASMSDGCHVAACGKNVCVVFCISECLSTNVHFDS